MLLLLLCCSNRCFFLDYQSCLLIQIAYSTVSLYYQKVLNFNNLNTEGFFDQSASIFLYHIPFFNAFITTATLFFHHKNSQKTKIFWDGNGNNIKKKTMKINKTEWILDLINKIFVVLNKKCLVNSSKKF